MENADERNSRTEMLIGSEALKKIKKSRVLVIGLGGVGGYAVEALARVGVGTLGLIDCDTVSESNINRQIIADYSTVGKRKTDAFCERIFRINPDCKTEPKNIFLTADNLSELSLDSYDYVVDAIDTVSAKLALAVECERIGVPLIASMGTGNKLNPTQLRIADIYDTSVCPLARVMRRELKRRGVKRLKVVFSTEEPKRVDTPSESEGKRPPASISFVPSAAGLIIASEVVKDIIGDIPNA